jgi:hypothetical protein
MSANAMQLLGRASGSPDGPQLLWDAFQAGQLTESDPREVIPLIWAYMDWPEAAIGAPRWTTLFRAAGFFTVPTTLAAPTQPITLYRGTTENRARSMAWSWGKTKAEQFRDRYRKQRKDAHLYTTTVDPDGVLALFNFRGEREAIVDPQFLTAVDRCD